MDIRNDISLRFLGVYIFIAITTIYILVRVVVIQHMPKWEKEAQKLEIKKFTIEARRGDICASDGSPLATSIPYYELHMDMGAPGLDKNFNVEVDSLALCLSRLLHDKSAKAYSAELKKAQKKAQEIAKEIAKEIAQMIAQKDEKVKEKIKEKIKEKEKDQGRYYLITPRKVSYSELQLIKKFPILRRGRNSGGLITEQENQRVYPSGNLALRTLGKLTKSGVGPAGNAGAFGLEQSFEKELKGEDGIAVKQNMSGRWFIISKDDPTDGKNVITTLDIKMQDQVTYSLKLQMEKYQAEYGTAILMEVETGDIKAIANFGRNHTGQLIGGYQNYAIGNAGCSEPGSTFKLVSLMAALEDGKIDTSTMVDTGNGTWKYKDKIITDSHHEKKGGHGKITAKHAFELSSNIGLAKLITQSYSDDESDFIDRITKLGILEKLDIGIQGEAKPYITRPGDKIWSGVSLASLSYGYALKLTPLQTLTFYNAVANGGTMMKPRLVKGITENGTFCEKIRTKKLIWSICSAKTIRKAKAMLEGVVTNGTAKALETKAYKIAGKTGTAQVANNKEGYSHGGKMIYQSSFAGYFPADHPKYSCIVVINSPKGGDYYGVSVAGPVFRKISDYVYAYELGLNEEIKLPETKIENDIPGIAAGRKKDIANVLDELDILNGFAFTKSDWVEAKPDEDGLELNNREIQKGIVPNVKGMGATDAVYLLETNGLRVSVKGRGKVKSQSIKSGAKIQRGQSIVLTLG